jgi:hypothetical protein
MGLFDKAKEMLGKTDTDSLKETAGSAKDKADDAVAQHGDKIPDAARDGYGKASDAAEKVIPGEDGNAGDGSED